MRLACSQGQEGKLLPSRPLAIVQSIKARSSSVGLYWVLEFAGEMNAVADDLLKQLRLSEAGQCVRAPLSAI